MMLSFFEILKWLLQYFSSCRNSQANTSVFLGPGLRHDQEVTGVSLASIKRGMHVADAWLKRELSLAPNAEAGS
jgi:hypothetical protein